MAVTIEKDTIIGEVLDIAPQSAPLFMAIGMHCLAAPLPGVRPWREACMVQDRLRRVPGPAEPVPGGQRGCRGGETVSFAKGGVVGLVPAAPPCFIPAGTHQEDMV